MSSHWWLTTSSSADVIIYVYTFLIPTLKAIYIELPFKIKVIMARVHHMLDTICPYVRQWVGLWQHLVAAGEHTHILQPHTHTHTHVHTYTLSGVVSSWALSALVLLWAISAPYRWQWNCSHLTRAHTHMLTHMQKGTHVNARSFFSHSHRCVIPSPRITCITRVPQMQHCINRAAHNVPAHEYLWDEQIAKLHVLFIFVSELYTLSIGVFVFAEYLLHYVSAVVTYGCLSHSFISCCFKFVVSQLCCNHPTDKPVSMIIWIRKSQRSSQVSL